jgi:hypothetical protein
VKSVIEHLDWIGVFVAGSESNPIALFSTIAGEETASRAAVLWALANVIGFEIRHVHARLDGMTAGPPWKGVPDCVKSLPTRGGS